MIAAFEAHEARRFHLGLVGYFIEGTPFSADSLLLDGDSAFDVAGTEDGFSCFSLFPPRTLTPEIVSTLNVQTDPAGTEFVVAHLEVRLRDVWLLAELVDGVGKPLYFDPEVMAQRKLAFIQEQESWRSRSDPHLH
jgi:hypothetical protein